MSMYLPNPDIRPTGHEAVEFLDVGSMAERAGASDAHDGERRILPVAPHAATDQLSPNPAAVPDSHVDPSPRKAWWPRRHPRR